MKKITCFAAFLFIFSSLSAQWTTAGSNIYNTNTGAVIIEASTPVGGQKLVVNPKGEGLITLGEANTGIGGFTSLNFYISAYQNGYSSIQSIKSSGTSFGVLSLNPDGGGVGIGTTNPGTFKLAVEGGIGARSLKVTLQSPFPDYVFKNDYPLLSLSNLEKYIQKHKHLPGIPTEEEVKNSDGLDLGEMNLKLLEKVEELTLYIIELNKKVEKLEKENK